MNQQQRQLDYIYWMKAGYAQGQLLRRHDMLHVQRINFTPTKTRLIPSSKRFHAVEYNRIKPVLALVRNVCLAGNRVRK